MSGSTAGSTAGSSAGPSAMEQAAATIGAAGYQAWSLSLSAATPAMKAYQERITNPQPGDLVVETSSFGIRERDGNAHSAVGTLVERVSETRPYGDEAPGEEPEYYTEQVWYVTPYLGGEAVRWVDAQFVAIPATQEQGNQWRRPPGARY